MKSRKLSLKVPAKLEKIAKLLRSLQNELARLVRNKDVLKEAKNLRGVVEKEAREILQRDTQRIKAFLNLARGELEDLQKQYVEPGKKTVKANIKKVLAKRKPKAPASRKSKSSSR